jgi:hypothetical protein
MKVILIISIIVMIMEINTTMIIMKIAVIKVTIIFQSSDYRFPTPPTGGSWKALGGTAIAVVGHNPLKSLEYEPF